MRRTTCLSLKILYQVAFKHIIITITESLGTWNFLLYRLIQSVIPNEVRNLKISPFGRNDNCRYIKFFYLPYLVLISELVLFGTGVASSPTEVGE